MTDTPVQFEIDQETYDLAQRGAAIAGLASPEEFLVLALRESFARRGVLPKSNQSTSESN